MKHIFFERIKHNCKNIILFLAVAVFYFTFGCPIRLLSGISCPSCGMSRAAFALARFDFALAFEMHPLVFLLPVAMAVYFLRKKIPKKIMTLLCVFAIVLLLVVYIIRMTQGGTVVYSDFESGLIYKMFQSIN